MKDANTITEAINPAEWYDTNDAARLIGRTASCLRTWRARDRGPVYSQPGGTQPRYLGQWLIEFLNENTTKPGEV